MYAVKSPGALTEAWRLVLVVGSLAVATLPARPATAQIVNVQPLVTSQEQDGFSGSVDGALDWRAGNVDLLLVSANLVTRFQADHHVLFLLAKGELGRQGDKTFLDRDFEHLRYRWMPGTLGLEGFVQHDRDEFRRLALRGLVGAGPRVVIGGADDLAGAAGAAYLFEVERLGGGDHPDAGAESRAHRLSSYLTLGVKAADKTRLAQSVYAQPRLDDPADVRVLSETELLVEITTRFALKLALTAAFDSRPPAGLERLDLTTKSGLQVKL